MNLIKAQKIFADNVRSLICESDLCPGMGCEDTCEMYEMMDIISDALETERKQMYGEV